MQDQPTPVEIIGAAVTFLQTEIHAEITLHALFQAKVAANALEIARRDLALSPEEDSAEVIRLGALLGRTGELLELTAALARHISEGTMDLATPGLLEHLWSTTLGKLAVDQPTYSGYRAVLADRARPL